MIIILIGFYHFDNGEKRLSLFSFFAWSRQNWLTKVLKIDLFETKNEFRLL